MLTSTMFSVIVPLLLLCVVAFSGASQVFPQSYEFRDRDHSVFSEPEATCPGDVKRNGKQYKVCYYDSETRPKLMDCDLGEETYQDGGAYPLLYGGSSRRTFKFRFIFDPPLNLSTVILHYYSSCSTHIDLRVKFGNTVRFKTAVNCADSVPLEVKNEPMTVNEDVTIAFTPNTAEDEVFLGEVQFFNGTNPAPADSCTVGSCCTNGATCHTNSSVPNGYECLCPVGFYGVNCQFRNCTSEPCQNGGNCTDLQGCTCPPGYSGRDCEEMLTSTTEVQSTTSIVTTSRVILTTTVNETTTPQTTSGTTIPTTSKHNQSGSSSPIAAAAAGTVVTVVVMILIVSGFVAVIVCYRRKKGKKSEKVIQHIGEDDSNTYALVDKPRKRAAAEDDSNTYALVDKSMKKAAPEVPPQNFDPMEEGLDKQEAPPNSHSDPSTGQASTSPNVYANNKCFDQDHLASSHSQEQPPAVYSVIHTPDDPYYSVPPSESSGHVYEDTVSAANPRSPTVAPLIPAPVVSGKDNIAMDTDMYSLVN